MVQATPTPTPAVDGEPAKKVSLSRFNLANDRYYDTNYTGKLVRVRQTFGQLVVQHSLPALKLQPPFVSAMLLHLVLVLIWLTHSPFTV